MASRGPLHAKARKARVLVEKQRQQRQQQQQQLLLKRPGGLTLGQ